MEGKRFLTVQDVASELKCSRWKVDRMLRDGTLPQVNISGLIRIPAEALDALAARAMGRTATVVEDQ